MSCNSCRILIAQRNVVPSNLKFAQTWGRGGANLWLNLKCGQLARGRYSCLG